MDNDKDKKATHSVGYWLRKLYFVERIKARYLSAFSFTNYRKACDLQEKIVLKIRSLQNQEKNHNKENPEYRTLSQKIKKQVEVNQVLLDDLKHMSQEFLKPFQGGYYNQEGSIQKTTKVFSTDV